ncbi:MAG TPA: TetR/AcrR family transcriptional regulator [Ktedonobacteraceae bacterium]|nr:TetR/AcrR family transcriptional regulator [Ktedonobacteraceae bacterium]
MEARKRREDRRIQRTREVLQKAFIEVVQEKGLAVRSIREVERCFATTSIQEITERANVNRGTFYLHFTDKYMLADAVIRETFRQRLLTTLPAKPRWDKQTLRLLTQAVLHILEEKYHHQHQPSPVLAPMVERAIQEELTAMLLEWLKTTRRDGKHRNEALETVARVVCWAIFGTAIQWSQEETTVSLDEIADIISQVIMEGVAKLTPDALPE